MDIPLIRWGLAVLLLPLWPLSVVAQSPKTGVVTALQGRATVARAALPQPAALRFKDDIFLHDRIGTGERSLVRILFGGKALVTVRERSELTITEEPNRHIVGLQDGRLALNLAKSLARPGEVVEIHTPNAIVGVRGSFVVVETRLVSGVRETDVTAVHVSQPVIVVSPIDPKLSVTITSGQTVSVRGLGATIAMAPVRAITPEEATAATRAGEVPLSAGRPIAPTVDQAEALAREQLRQAAFLADSLLGGTSVSTGGQPAGSAGAILSGGGILAGSPATGMVNPTAISPIDVNRTLNNAIPAINVNRLGL